MEEVQLANVSVGTNSLNKIIRKKLKEYEGKEKEEE